MEECSSLHKALVSPSKIWCYQRDNKEKGYCSFFFENYILNLFSSLKLTLPLFFPQIIKGRFDLNGIEVDGKGNNTFESNFTINMIEWSGGRINNSHNLPLLIERLIMTGDINSRQVKKKERRERI